MAYFLILLGCVWVGRATGDRPVAPLHAVLGLGLYRAIRTGQVDRHVRAWSLHIGQNVGLQVPKSAPNRHGHQVF